MRVRIPGVDLEATQLLLAECPMLQHARHRVPERIGRMPHDHVAVGALAKAARISGVRGVDLVGWLLPGHPDALEVDDDHVVARVQVRGVPRLVLPAQSLCHVGGEPAQRLPAGIDDVPASRDLRWLGAVRLSWQGPFQYSTAICTNPWGGARRNPVVDPPRSESIHSTGWRRRPTSTSAPAMRRTMPYRNASAATAIVTQSPAPLTLTSRTYRTVWPPGRGLRPNARKSCRPASRSPAACMAATSSVSRRPQAY